MTPKEARMELAATAAGVEAMLAFDIQAIEEALVRVREGLARLREANEALSRSQAEAHIEARRL